MFNHVHTKSYVFLFKCDFFFNTSLVALLSLLKWESYAGDLGELMNRFTFVDQVCY
jgi:hypothetical protein